WGPPLRPARGRQRPPASATRSSLRALPARSAVVRYRRPGQERCAANVIGRLFRQHDGRRVQIAGGDRGHDRGVDHAQRLDANDSRLRVNPRLSLGDAAHPARARGVEGALAFVADEGVDLLVTLNARSRLNLPAAIAIESRLREDLA